MPASMPLSAGSLGEPLDIERRSKWMYDIFHNAAIITRQWLAGLTVVSCLLSNSNKGVSSSALTREIRVPAWLQRCFCNVSNRQC